MLRSSQFLSGASLSSVLFLQAGLLSACGKSKPMGVSTNPNVIAASKRQPEPKVEVTCLAPAKVLAGAEYTCADGKKLTGTFTEGNVPKCKEDGEKGCLATVAFPAVEKARLTPGVLKAGVTIAKMKGEYPSTFS